VEVESFFSRPDGITSLFRWVDCTKLYPPGRLPDVRKGATRGARLPAAGRDEAVISKAKERADSRSCRALGREEAQVL